MYCTGSRLRVPYRSINTVHESINQRLDETCASYYQVVLLRRLLYWRYTTTTVYGVVLMGLVVDG